jgi:predicted RNA polymerase sigma factor
MQDRFIFVWRLARAALRPLSVKHQRGLIDVDGDQVLSFRIGDHHAAIQRLIFTACHPVLTVEAHTVLTLRPICGLVITTIQRKNRSS